MFSFVFRFAMQAIPPIPIHISLWRGLSVFCLSV